VKKEHSPEIQAAIKKGLVDEEGKARSSSKPMIGEPTDSSKSGKRQHNASKRD
jgi:hypothetical protein